MPITITPPQRKRTMATAIPLPWPGWLRIAWVLVAVTTAEALTILTAPSAASARRRVGARKTGSGRSGARTPLSLHAVEDRDGHEDGHGHGLFGGVAEQLFQRLSTSVTLPSLPDPRDSTADLLSMVTDVLASSRRALPDLQLPPGLPALVRDLLRASPEGKEGDHAAPAYRKVHEFDAVLGADIEEALRLANNLAAGRGLGGMTLRPQPGEEEEEPRDGNGQTHPPSRREGLGPTTVAQEMQRPPPSAPSPLQKSHRHVALADLAMLQDRLRREGSGGGESHLGVDPDSNAHTAHIRSEEEVHANSADVKQPQHSETKEGQRGSMREERYANVADVKQQRSEARAGPQGEGLPPPTSARRSTSGGQGGREEESNFWDVKKPTRHTTTNTATRPANQHAPAARHMDDLTTSENGNAASTTIRSSIDFSRSIREEEGSFWDVKKTTRHMAATTAARPTHQHAPAARQMDDTTTANVGGAPPLWEKAATAVAATAWEAAATIPPDPPAAEARAAPSTPPGSVTEEEEPRRESRARETYEKYRKYFEGHGGGGVVGDGVGGGNGRAREPPQGVHHGIRNDNADGGMAMTEAALALARSLQLDSDAIRRHKARGAAGERVGRVDEQDVRDYLDHRYDRLLSTLAPPPATEHSHGRREHERRRGSEGGAQGSSVPRPPRYRPPAHVPGVHPQKGRRASSEGEDFVAEDDWGARYDQHRDIEDVYGWRTSQFRRPERRHVPAPPPLQPPPPRQSARARRPQHEEPADWYDTHLQEEKEGAPEWFVGRPDLRRAPGNPDDHRDNQRNQRYQQDPSGHGDRRPLGRGGARQGPSGPPPSVGDGAVSRARRDGGHRVHAPRHPPPPVAPGRPPSVSVPLSQLISDPRSDQKSLRRALAAAAQRQQHETPPQEPFDLSRFHATSQADFRQTYNLRNAAAPPTHGRPAPATPSAAGRQHREHGDDDDAGRTGRVAFQDMAQSEFRQPYQGSASGGAADGTRTTAPIATRMTTTAFQPLPLELAGVAAEKGRLADDSAVETAVGS